MKNKVLAPRNSSEVGWNVVNWDEVDNLFDKSSK